MIYIFNCLKGYFFLHKYVNSWVTLLVTFHIFCPHPVLCLSNRLWCTNRPKIQLKTIDFRMRLWGINSEFVEFIYSQSLVSGYIVFGWILMYQNWFISWQLLDFLLKRSCFTPTVNVGVTCLNLVLFLVSWKSTRNHMWVFVECTTVLPIFMVVLYIYGCNNNNNNNICYYYYYYYYYYHILIDYFLTYDLFKQRLFLSRNYRLVVTP